MAARTLLEWHVAATGSVKATDLLADWETTRTPRGVRDAEALLLQYQDADAILSSKTRKELLDELAAALAGHQVAKFKRSYRDDEYVLGGAVPGYASVTDTEDMYALLNTYTVLNMAQQLALSRLPGVTDVTDARVARQCATWCSPRLLPHSEAAEVRAQCRGRFHRREPGGVVANKRITDYKAALTQRNVLSTDSPGTYGWILHQDSKNVERIGRLPSFEELFAAQSDPRRRGVVRSRWRAHDEDRLHPAGRAVQRGSARVDLGFLPGCTRGWR